MYITMPLSYLYGTKEIMEVLTLSYFSVIIIIKSYTAGQY